MPSGLACRTGLAPWGYRREGGRLVEVPAELAIADRACELRGQGLSLRQIARVLAAEGMTSRTGQPLSTRSLALVLARAGVHEPKPRQPARLRPPGRWTGGLPPWGFKIGPGGMLVACELEREIVDVVLELRHVSGCSFRQIADQLFVEGYRSRTGTRITVQRVARMIWTHVADEARPGDATSVP